MLSQIWGPRVVPTAGNRALLVFRKKHVEMWRLDTSATLRTLITARTWFSLFAVAELEGVSKHWF
jgi:hypothetical protein